VGSWFVDCRGDAPRYRSFYYEPLTTDHGPLTTNHGPLPTDLAFYLDQLVERFEQPAFIADDPIAIPHGFDDPADREVIGLYAALLAWGRRSVILSKLEELCDRMRYRPAAFVHDFSAERDGRRLDGFTHRTFQPEDAFHLTRALKVLVRRHGSLETVFARHLTPESTNVGPAIQGFSEDVMAAAPGIPTRLQKHLARPSTGSACKRLAMYLRWMVRPGPVDFGQWTGVRPYQLVLPVDVHTGRQARLLGLLSRPTDDWAAVMEVTMRLQQLSPTDPARYDFALFGAGVSGIAHPADVMRNA
jgi:uncharacterized protein (TIGR02757 family)